MQRLSLFLFALALALVLPWSVTAQPADAGRTDVIVLFDDSVSDARRADLLRAAGAITRRQFRHVPAAAAAVDAPGRAFLETQPGVRAVIPDRPVEKFGKPTGGDSTGGGEIVPAGVARIGADKVAGTGADVGVAIVDTGIDFAHTDLRVASACFTSYAACQDDDGHGTHVAGTVAALKNGQDVVGVAPGATVYAVKVLNQNGSGTDSTIMEGLDWIADNAALVVPRIRVVNMSLGRQGSVDDNPALHAAVRALYDAGIVVVVAAGNNSSLTVDQQVPAAYPQVLAIASTTATAGNRSACRYYSGFVPADTASYFSTDGEDVAISAPGETAENIGKNCFISSSGIRSTRLGGGTTTMSGTSMAAPHVTGVVALMAESTAPPTKGTATDDARRRIRDGADRAGAAPLNGVNSGYTFDGVREGILSAPGALAAH